MVNTCIHSASVSGQRWTGEMGAGSAHDNDYGEEKRERVAGEEQQARPVRHEGGGVTARIKRQATMKHATKQDLLSPGM